MGDDQRIYKVTSTGMEKLKELGISSTEMEALKTALAEGIMNSKKKPQIKKDTLCSLLDKLVPNHPWFSLQVPEEGAPLAVIEAGKQDAKKKLEEALQGATSSDSPEEKPICKHFMRGACRFGASGKLVTPQGTLECPDTHPQTCLKFERKGYRGCEEPCAAEKTHRTICKHFEKGTCAKGANCTSGIHPFLLGKILSDERKKEEEEKKAKEQEKKEHEDFLEDYRNLKKMVFELKKEVEECRNQQNRPQTVHYVQQPPQMMPQLAPTQVHQPPGQIQNIQPPPPQNQGAMWPSRM